MSLGRIAFQGPVAIIGDIHGSLGLLQQLLVEVGDLPLIVLGDVCDRGPDTKGVIDVLIAKGAIGVRGNHEDWFYQWARGEGFDTAALSPLMGGRATLDSYGVAGRTPREIETERRRVPRAHVGWLGALADALDLEVAGQHYWVVHAGVPPLRADLQVPVDQIVPWFVAHWPGHLRNHDQPLGMAPRLDRPLIVGHQALPEPFLSERLIALDTGAGTRRERPGLTALVLPGRMVVTVRAS